MFFDLFRRKKPASVGSDPWPFRSPPNEAVLTVGEILSGQKPILRVSHDSEDGMWQFLTGGPVSMQDAKLVGLSNIAKLDPTVFELADLPEGWIATRASVGEEWERSPAEPDDA